MTKNGAPLKSIQNGYSLKVYSSKFSEQFNRLSFDAMLMRMCIVLFQYILFLVCEYWMWCGSRGLRRYHKQITTTHQITTGILNKRKIWLIHNIFSNEKMKTCFKSFKWVLMYLSVWDFRHLKGHTIVIPYRGVRLTNILGATKKCHPEKVFLLSEYVFYIQSQDKFWKPRHIEYSTKTFRWIHVLLFLIWIIKVVQL